MGLRLILIIAGIWILYTIIRRYIQQRHSTKQDTPPGKSVEMVKCAYCDTHLPAPDAIEYEEKYYCCQAHLEQEGATDRDDS